ncbi:MAG: ribbon-helix-helix domain-containing protein [Nanoarchaeota archaeon]|nr:ribbon-helix-helix domain-containing protein [Nanoarchaeota archaeon]MBU3904593.1 ribbon-helix-helix domain-containing protein [Nanoarchaeota archaeon]MBU4124365.1 ribbon-helix-helix domain-containing protein [Nanoarchaeota archaeon]
MDPTKILINLTDYHIEELDKLVKMGVYQHKAEAIRDAIRKLIEGRL